MALEEEISNIKDNLVDGSDSNPRQVYWENVFTNCFVNVDGEVGGTRSRGVRNKHVDSSNLNFEPVAPETVGSTALVAVVCSSHIIVANCGDSRAVLCRGKEAIPLSTDHKVSNDCHLIKFSNFNVYRESSTWLTMFYWFIYVSSIYVPAKPRGRIC